MNFLRRVLHIACRLALLASVSASAGQVSLRGTLPIVLDDANSTYSYSFSLTTASSVVIQSYGYGGSGNAPGGRNLAGASITPNGFDPYLSLFAGSGPAATFIASNDDGACPPATAVAGTCGDPQLVRSLAAGTYTLVVSAFANMSLAENLGTGTLGDGFIGLGLYDPARTTSFAVDLSSPGIGVRRDFNADGKADILWRNGTTGQVYRQLMNGLAVASGAIAYTEPNTAWKIVADADFNGDGVTDLLWRNDSTGQVYVMPFTNAGLPTGGAIVYTEPNASWKIIHTPDFDGDGKADILWWNSTTGQLYGMLMNGTAVGATSLFYTEPNTAWKIVAVGDFAGSGSSNQLVWRNSSTGQVYLMTVTVSGGTFSQSGVMIYQEPNTAWKIIAAADFDGDGKSDLLWRNEVTGQVFIMLMNGGSIASQALVYTEPNLAWKIVAQGDYDGDGKADLLWRNDTTGQVYMMLMSGTAISSAAIVYQEPNTAWKILGPWEYGQATGILQ